jgi:hypothetical protein
MMVIGAQTSLRTSIKFDDEYILSRISMSDKPETPAEKEQDISFPSDSFVTYKKMNETVMKFVELGGGPFTQDEIESKMKELTAISIVTRRVLPFLRYLGFMARSRFGRTGAFTYTLNPEIRDELTKNLEAYDSIFVKLCKTSPAYLVVWKYAGEVKTNKFLISAFEKQYLENTLKISYSHKGLAAWLSALDKVKLLGLKEGFISLEGITSPLEPTPKTPDTGQSKSLSGGEPQTPPSDEGIAPGININVDLKLDYRQAPDLQRDYMTWLDKMSSKPTVRMSIKRIEEGKESTTEKKTDQS